jgi:hypothetical protein
MSIVNNRRVEELDLQELDLQATVWLYKGINYKIALL